MDPLLQDESRKIIALAHQSSRRVATSLLVFIYSIVETGNDLYNTAVRLRLILFSKDIGAF